MDSISRHKGVRISRSGKRRGTPAETGNKKVLHGYEIITALNDKASVLGYAKEGTIYPILYRLQEAELIQCRLAPAAANGGSKKYYSLTQKGTGILNELISFWTNYTDCVNSFIDSYQQAEVVE